MAIDELQPPFGPPFGPLFGPGQRLGRYQLTQRLAVGGMAEVYLAVASGVADFRKVVAIKRLLPQHALDPQLLRMFLDEARLMARLSHPNVVQVTDVGEGAGVEVPYFVMEYIHGTDLRGVLNAADGPLPIEHALAIASAVAAGLHHAHDQRGENGQPLEIVHRDISPSNVLISFSGAVRVTDFGVAKWAEQRSFTHHGQLKGKFAHMSPEQCRGEPLDRRSDVFALGTLLYEMITGAPPFVAESEYELLTQIVSQDAPPPKRTGSDAPEVPPELAFIIKRSLERARDDRYPTAQALQLDLEAFAREHKLIVSPVALAGYLESLFGARVTEWRQALESGRTLADHLVGASATTGTELPDRTATDAFAFGGQPPATATGHAEKAPPRAISRKRVIAGGLTLAIVGVVTAAATLGQKRDLSADPPPTRAAIGPSIAPSIGSSLAPPLAPSIAPSTAPSIASRATPATTFPRRQTPRAAAPESTVPATMPRNNRRSREIARADRPSGAPTEQETLDPTPTPETKTRTSPETGATQVIPEATLAIPPAAAIPAPAALKVWDPDSPVPP